MPTVPPPRLRSGRLALGLIIAASTLLAGGALVALKWATQSEGAPGVSAAGPDETAASAPPSAGRPVEMPVQAPESAASPPATTSAAQEAPPPSAAPGTNATSPHAAAQPPPTSTRAAAPPAQRTAGAAPRSTAARPAAPDPAPPKSTEPRPAPPPSPTGPGKRTVSSEL